MDERRQRPASRKSTQNDEQVAEVVKILFANIPSTARGSGGTSGLSGGACCQKLCSDCHRFDA